MIIDQRGKETEYLPVIGVFYIYSRWKSFGCQAMEGIYKCVCSSETEFHSARIIHQRALQKRNFEYSFRLTICSINHIVPACVLSQTEKDLRRIIFYLGEDYGLQQKSRAGRHGWSGRRRNPCRHVWYCYCCTCCSRHVGRKEWTFCSDGRRIRLDSDEDRRYRRCQRRCLPGILV